MMENPYILVVDDQPANLLAITSLLEGIDVVMVTASSGNEALARILEHEFALVLLDVQMPEMDGFETAALMRGMKQTRNVPIIFVTAISKEDEHIFKGYDSGAIDYLFKPINPLILRSKVKIFLQLYNQKRLLEEKSSELALKVEELLEVKQQIEDANQHLGELSLTDPLTGLANRRRFNEALQAEWRRALRGKHQLTMILVDIDCFKLFNDTYGHLAGDECLKKIARAMQHPLMRPSDLAVRFGGEEFVILLPNTELKGGSYIAENIRQDVERLAIPHKDSYVSKHVTVSLGIAATIPRMGITELDLLSAADNALYKAKETGKNRCVSASLA